MTKSQWESTPFATLEEAHTVASKMGMNPSSIIASDTLRCFQIQEGRDTHLVAQRLDGGPVLEKVLGRKGPKPPLQDPNAPSFRDTDRLQVGPWQLSDYEALEDVEAYWRKQIVNFENVEVLTVIMYRIDKDEYEYAADGQGIWTRVLHVHK